MVHFMSAFAGRTVGIECNDAQLSIAQAGELNDNEQHLAGVGQILPFDDGIFDLVTFFNSLHHIPTDLMLASLMEASRVLKPEGVIYVAEPIAQGSGFEVHAPVDDETLVRAAALSTIHEAIDHGLILDQEIFYNTVYHYSHFGAFEEELVRIDSTRQARFDELREELQGRFASLSVKDELGFRFDQPMRVNILKKSK